jgi:hypothetical protein
MAIQVQGNAGIIAEVESASRAVRTTPRPIDIGSLGSYSVGMTSGVMAAGLAANSEIFQFHWSNSANLALIRRVTISGGNAGTAFAAGVAIFGMRAARAFTAVGSGGTTATLAGNDQKRRTSFGTTLLTSAADIRIASTAALGTGTKTLDNNDLGSATAGVLATAGTTVVPVPTDLYAPNFSGEWPLVLAQNEGFVIRATVPATGTWTFSVTVEWTEIASF